MDKNVINKFSGKYEFLSNFFPCYVTYDGDVYSSVERAFQAAKCLNKSDRIRFQVIGTNADAKKLGRQVDLRPDWETLKVDIMYQLLKSKFQNNAELRNKLVDTGDSRLVEGNQHGDTFWGVYKGNGKNMLGNLLERVRSEIREEMKHEYNTGN